MKTLITILIGAIVLISGDFQGDKCEIEFHSISAQTYGYGRYIGLHNTLDTLSIRSFELSDLITYGQYKVYLKKVKSDSGKVYYLKQLPDSNMCLPNCYNQYVNSTEYDDYPVVGISWEAAMNFCKWLTLKNNSKTIESIYRIPTRSEWISAHHYYKGRENFSKDYSEWLLNSYDESVINWGKEIPIRDYTYSAKTDDPPVLKRKHIIGNSFLFQREYLKDFNSYGYSYSGYRQNAFRVIIEKENDHTSKWDNYFKWILKDWGLINDK